MSRYSAGKDVRVSVPVKDQAGNAFSASGARYRVIDETGAELVAPIAIAPWSESETEAEVVVLASDNTLEPGIATGLRIVEVYFTTDAGEIRCQESYAIEAGDPLVAPENSFQNYAEAEFTALSMSELAGWEVATREVRVVALIEAWHRIIQLRFRFNFDIWQNVVEPRFAAGDLGIITLAEFQALPHEFVAALRRAQVAEANAILGGDPVDDLRKHGLLSKTVGESSQMYRPGKPLELPVCARAMHSLAKYIDWQRRISR